MADTFTSRTESSEESLEAAGLEVVVAAATTATRATDDVWIDGNIITAENYDTAMSQDGNDLLIVNNGDGSDFLEGGAGNDFVQVNGANGAGDDFSIDPNGAVVRDGGEGNDLLIGGDGNDVLLGDRGNDRSQEEEGADPMTTADTLVFMDAGPGGAEIEQQDFYYQEYGDTRDADVVPAETFSLNYEEIKFVDDASFDSVFDAV